jgi:hypothetical protein
VQPKHPLEGASMQVRCMINVLRGCAVKHSRIMPHRTHRRISSHEPDILLSCPAVEAGHGLFYMLVT